MDNKQRYAIMAKHKKTILEHCPNAKEVSGIYAFYRIDEDGIKFAYVGQAKNLLERLASHLMGFQHIDNSLQKRKFYNQYTNPYGYIVRIVKTCTYGELNEVERAEIIRHAKSGYQMYNKDTGGGKGKESLNERKQPKGYKRGVDIGRKHLVQDLKKWFKYFDVSLKKDTVNANKAMEKFTALLNEYNEEDKNND